MTDWRTLSDDELHARLAQRRPSVAAAVIEVVVGQRGDAPVAEIIDGWLS